MTHLPTLPRSSLWASKFLVPLAHKVAQDQELQNGTNQRSLAFFVTNLCLFISQPLFYICYWAGKSTEETKKKYFILYIALYTYKMINELYMFPKNSIKKLNQKRRASEKSVWASKFRKSLAHGQVRFQKLLYP